MNLFNLKGFFYGSLLACRYCGGKVVPLKVGPYRYLSKLTSSFLKGFFYLKNHPAMKLEKKIKGRGIARYLSGNNLPG